jgi:hypothetical protein
MKAINDMAEALIKIKTVSIPNITYHIKQNFN